MKRFALALGLTVAMLAGARPATAAPITDPTGDTLGFFSPQLDVTTYQAELLHPGNTIRFNFTFSGPISPGSAFAPDSVTGYIDIDADRNAATGNTSPLVNVFAGPPPFNLGSELFIDLFSEQFSPGFVNVHNATTFALIGTVPITFTANGFTLDLPTSFLPPGSNPNPYYAGVFGTLLEPTDRVPNGADPAVVTPEPTSLLVFGLASVAAAGYGWRRRRHPK